MNVTFDTEEAIEQLLAPIKGFKQEGVDFVAKSGKTAIDGLRMLEDLLKRIPSVTNVQVGEHITALDIDVDYYDNLLNYLDLRGKLESTPVNVLKKVVNLWGISVDAEAFESDVPGRQFLGLV